MTTVAICGGAELRTACEVLGLEDTGSRPRLVLVDLRVADAARAAAAFEAQIPRVVIGTPDQTGPLAALGDDRVLIAGSSDPAVLGPLVVRALPRAARDRTRVITLTTARGGTGRTLCAANLARRLAADRTVLAVDATGTGALGWWLAVEPRPWADLEALAGELRPEHVELVATPAAPRLAVVGGAPTLPSPDLLAMTIAAARERADLVLIDAPALPDDRSRTAVARSDRVLVLSYADPASTAVLLSADVPVGAWIIGSQCQSEPIADAFRVLPRDERAVADALTTRGRAGGALGRAYDELAELLAIDAA
ncbi:MAG TPA: cellulose synthase operon protein YhjQ/BcsQ [Candidatus Saccharimonadales bacterium]|nr:cellulose synthase operon protein YhjQ/BcsQ [Candidatus Saccharimonadales bacterium]